MIPALIMLAFIPFMPRSPRWLASKDRWEEAHDVLALLHAKGDRMDPLVLAELQQIKEKIFFERDTGSTSWLELVKPRNVMRTQAAVCAHLWSQFSGNNALMYYIGESSSTYRTAYRENIANFGCEMQSTSSKWPVSKETSSSYQVRFSTASALACRCSLSSSWITIDDAGLS